MFSQIKEHFQMKTEIKRMKRGRKIERERVLNLIAEKENSELLREKMNAIELNRVQSECNHNYKLINIEKEIERGVTYFLTIESVTHIKYHLKCVNCNKAVSTYSESKKEILLSN